MKSPHLKCILTVAFCCFYSGLAPSTAHAQEAPKPAGPEAIKKWVKQLGDEDFQKRSEAKTQLKKVGKSAIPFLQEAISSSPELEVKNAAKAILKKLKWMIIPSDVNYLEVFPQESIYVVHVPDRKKTTDTAKKSPLGKLIMGAEFTALRGAIFKEIEKDKKEFDEVMKWADRFAGQMGGVLWGFDLTDPFSPKIGAAAIFEFSPDNAQKHFKDFLKNTAFGQRLKPKSIGGLSIYSVGVAQGRPAGQGSVALVGHHMIIAPYPGAILKIANNIVEKPAKNLSNKATYLSLNKHLNDNPDFTLLVDMKEYMKLMKDITGTIPMAPGMGGLLDTVSNDNLSAVAISSTVTAQGVEDRIVTLVGNKENAHSALMKMPWNSQATLKKIFSIVPADAVMVGNSYVEGETVVDWGLKIFESGMKTVGPMMAMMGGPAQTSEQMLKIAETAMGISIKEFGAGVKGDMVFWSKLGKGLEAPEFGMAFGCPSAAKAKEFAATLSRVSNSITKAISKKEAGAIEKITKGGKDIYAESEDSPLLADPQRKAVPFRLCWTAHEDKIIFSSSVEKLQLRLLAISTKEPAFDPTKYIPEKTPVNAAAKSMLFIDVPTFLNYANQFGSPFMAKQAKKEDTDIKKILVELSQKQKLFSELAPFVSFNYPPTDGVQITIATSPTGTLPLFYGAATGIGFGFLTLNEDTAVAPAARPAPAPAPPKKVKVIQEEGF